MIIMILTITLSRKHIQNNNSNLATNNSLNNEHTIRPGEISN